jgi:cholesterol transport system auxiliary component
MIISPAGQYPRLWERPFGKAQDTLQARSLCRRNVIFAAEAAPTGKVLLRRVNRSLLCLALTVLLTGCLMRPAERPATYHVLTDPGPVIKSPQTHPGVLLVRQMDASAFYQAPRLVYSREPGTRAHYEYARWSEPPTQRLTWILTQRLESSEVFAVVAPLGGGVSGDYQLNTRLIDFYHEASVPPGVVLLVLEAELVRRGAAELMSRRLFVAQVPVAAFDAERAADAMGRAANQVMDELTAWVAQAASGPAR